MTNSEATETIKHNNSIEKLIIERRDASLIKNACDGDMKSFAQLVSLYQKRVKLFGLSFFKNTTDAEDFVQEVFIKVYTKLSSFRGESLFSTWLMRIAYNQAINSINRRKVYVSLSDENTILDNDLDPESKQLKNFTILAIREAIKELPEKYSVCLDMYFFYDMSYIEIAEVTELPINTIKSHIFRAKKILKDKLQDYVID